MGTAPATDLQSLTFRLVSFPDWRAATLAILLHRLGPSVSIHAPGTTPDMLPAIERVEVTIRKRLVDQDTITPAKTSGHPCHNLWLDISDYFADIEDGKTPAPPFASYSFGNSDKCLGLTDADIGQVHLLTVRADDLDSLFVSAGTTTHAHLRWLDRGDFIEFEGHRIAVVAVPRGAPVTLRGQAKNQELPTVWHGIVTHDQTVWNKPFSLGCVSISARVGPKVTLLLDGHPIVSEASISQRIVNISAGDHEVVAIECYDTTDGQSCRVRFRETARQSVRTTTRNLCEDIRLDLKQQDTVSLLGVTTQESCEGSTVWPGDIEDGTTRALRQREAATGRAFKDLAAYATLTGALGSLKSQLNPDDGKVTGAATGADGMELLGTAAKEAWRQGIDSLVSLDLRCINKDSGEIQYSLGAKLVSVREVFQRQRGDLEGINLDHFIRQETVSFDNETQLNNAIDRVVDRLFGIPHIRFLNNSRQISYRSSIDLRVASYGGVKKLLPSKDSQSGLQREEYEAVQPIIEARRIANGYDNRTPRICRELESSNFFNHQMSDRLEAVYSEASRLPRVKIKLKPSDQPLDFSRRKSVKVYRVNVRAPRPLTYLIVARWPKGHPLEGKVADATCTALSVDDTEFWGDFGITGGVALRSDMPGQPESIYVRLRLGQSYYRPYPFLSFGWAVGYAYQKSTLADGLPSWVDVGAPPEGSTEPLIWARHSLLLGPTIESRSRSPSIPVEFHARFMPALNLGLVDVSKINSEYTNFLGTTSEVTTVTDIGLDLFLDLGISFRGGPVSISPKVIMGINSLEDWVQGSSRTLITNGASFFIGAGISLGGIL